MTYTLSATVIDQYLSIIVSIEHNLTQRKIILVLKQSTDQDRTVPKFGNKMNRFTPLFAVIFLTSAFAGEPLPGVSKDLGEAGEPVPGVSKDLGVAMERATMAVEKAAVLYGTCVSEYPSLKKCEEGPQGYWQCTGIRANHKESCANKPSTLPKREHPG